jgi:NAD(P)-dependent dehydrogenase (short-subunit alcohol dehydrogenase family)
VRPVALITGASSGIGAACAPALVDAGFDVALTARRRERLEQVAADIAARCGEGHALVAPGDATDEADRRRTVEAMFDRWGRWDVLLQSAGTALPGAVEDLDLDAVRRQFEINVIAAVAFMQLAGPVMRDQGAGRIINVSSISGRVAFPALGAYAAAKFALEAFSDAARLEYRPWGVHVVLVEPGSVATEIWDRSRGAGEARRREKPDSAFMHLYDLLAEHAAQMAQSAPPAGVVARTVVRAATTRRPRARYRVPAEARWLNLLTLLPTAWRDALISASVPSPERAPGRGR